ncbi:CU044_2847 family protein [Sphaerotilus sp.]|uniref:CU044_2847 family protein n=1 Tax=Sphaerotilus sp. TaxID=2093942 RepID=UPI002ACE4BC5|nr:CU044_2847 family protein [Sphaerotilus sp.]MDZ7858363.1 CU044_2847 family protein [Sphaerotilus sp.]
MSTTKLITIDGVQVYVEVEALDLPVPADATAPGTRGIGQRRNVEPTGVAEKLGDVGDQLRAAIKSITGPMHSALKELPPDEWTIELNIGFKGQAGIPCITKGEANASVKVTAKWKKSGA